MTSTDCVDRYNELSARTTDEFYALETVFIELFECSQKDMTLKLTYLSAVDSLKMHDQIWRNFCFMVGEDIYADLYRKYAMIVAFEHKECIIDLKVLTDLGWM